MAFWKNLFRRKYSHTSSSENLQFWNDQKKKEAEVSPPKAFLAELLLALDSFLKEQNGTKGDPAFPESMRAVSVQGGTFQGGAVRNTLSRRKAEEKPYLFMRVPGQPGFLLETAELQKLWLSRATMVQPLHTDLSGDTAHPLMFVAQLPSPLETFHFLDSETVRSSQGRTLTIEQFAEMLLTLAYENLREPLKN